MKYKLTISSLPLLALLLAVSPSALAATTWYVNGVNGNNTNNCKSPTAACKTISHAITLASSGDSIMVAAATYRENLTISKSLKVIGSGAPTTILDGRGAARVVTVPNTSTSVILSRMTIRNGRALQGGGVSNSGILTINSTTISGNEACCVPIGGGGILNLGTLTIYNSTVSGNFATGPCSSYHLIFRCWGGEGGGIFSGFSGGTLTINNSTVSGNEARCGPFPCVAPSAGGGIYSLGTLTIYNSTASGNGAGIGGGINGEATFQNSIVAYNSGNCSGTMTSNGYNLSSDNTCNFNSTGDLNNTDPMLGPLQNNGGPTQTQALPTGSPAIDAGNPSGCTDGSGHLLTKDQRGYPRPDKEDTGGCDMGAYERQSD